MPFFSRKMLDRLGLLALLMLLAAAGAGRASAQQIAAPPGFSVLQYGELPPNLYYGTALVAEFQRSRIVGSGPFDRLDLLMTGLRSPRALNRDENLPFTSVYSHLTELRIDEPGAPPIEEYSFSSRGAGLPGLLYSYAAATDFDRDGDLDFALLGATQGGEPFEPEAGIYANNGQDNLRFNRMPVALAPVYYGSVDWGDYDLDADEDLLLTGVLGDGSFTTRLYRNNADGSFEEIIPGVAAVGYGHATWGDYDGDDDLDILLSGAVGPGDFITRIYRNDSGTFVDSGVALPGMAFSRTAWIDIDADGRLDVLVSGGVLNPFLMEGRIAAFLNRGDGRFTAFPVEGAGLFDGHLSTGDYDGDGDVDFVVSGRAQAAGSPATRLFRNDGDAFRSVYSFQQTINTAFALADADRDLDLDLFMTGFNPNAAGLAVPMTQFYINGSFNIPPTAPTGLTATAEGDTITFSWDASVDPGALDGAVTYNLRVGSFPGESDVLTPLAEASGLRWVSRPGNAGHGTTHRLVLPAGGYYWSVQAVDAAYAGSEFAPEQFVSTGDPNDRTPPEAPGPLTARSGDASIAIAWPANPAPDLAAYRLYRSGAPGATDPLIQLPRQTTRYLDTDVVFDSTYYYRLTAIDASGNESAFSEEVAVQLQLTFRIKQFFNSNGARDAAWGDYDNDGDYDLLLPNLGGSHVLRNQNGRFNGQPTGTNQFGINGGAVAWADYDRDGDIDASVSGIRGTFGQPFSLIAHNLGGTISFQDADSLINGANGGAAWGDLDNDGDPDLAITGQSRASDTTIVYLNLTSEGQDAFINTYIALPALSRSKVYWIDFNNDGNLDLFLTGGGIAQLYANNGGTLEAVTLGAPFPNLVSPAVAWGDYDNDGDLDLFLAGRDIANNQPLSALYTNEGDRFSRFMSGIFPAFSNGDAAWGDYDNDGDLDLALAGAADSGLFARILVNEGDRLFLNAGITLRDLSSARLQWADHDRDGDLDLLLLGLTTQNAAQLFDNLLDTVNQRPEPPTALTADVVGGTVTLRWNRGTDTETPAPGLSYNLRIGTSPGGFDIVSPESDVVTGRRLIPSLGNVQQSRQWSSSLLPAGTYYAAVQSIDGGYAGSVFSDEVAFTVSSGKSGQATDVDEGVEPGEVALLAGYPNPFRASTLIAFVLPTASRVRLAVYDVLGRRVRLLAEGPRPAGRHTVGWDGHDEAGRRLASGLYLYRLEVSDGGPRLSRTVTLLH